MAHKHHFLRMVVNLICIRIVSQRAWKHPNLVTLRIAKLPLSIAPMLCVSKASRRSSNYP